MPSTYSSLKIQLMATGENNTTWGDVTNLNLGTAMEEAIVGSADVAFSNANVTLTLTDTNASQTARNLRLNLTGTATAGYNLVVPAIEKPYIINNGTDGTITVKNATGTGIAVPAGKTMWVYNDGTNVVDAVTRLSSLTLGSALAVSSGGTGANTFTSNGILLGNGTSAISATAAGTTGQVLVGNTGSAPSWATLSTSAVTSFSAGTTGLTPNSATTGAITLAGTLNVANGGTGATSLTSGYLVKGNGTSAASASVVYDNGTNVGIGTTSPTAKFVVSNAGAAGYEVNPTGGVGGGATVATYNRSTSAYTSLTTYSSTMTWYAGGSTRAMDLDSSGNVGIGTSSPSGRLDVVATSAGGTTYSYFQNNGASGVSSAGLAFAQSGSIKSSIIAAVYGNDYMTFNVGSNTERMRIDSSGNVGIGVSAGIAGKLDVLAGADQRFLVRELGTGSVVLDAVNAANSAYMPLITNGSVQVLRTGAAERMRIDSSGNVGIGTSSPGYKLEVNGTTGSSAYLLTGSSHLIYSGSSTEIAFRIGASGPYYGLGTTGSSNLRLNNASGGDMLFSISANEYMRINYLGNVGIGTSSPNAAARLDVSSTTSGFLPPRMTTTQRDAISSPPNGLVLYNSTTDKLQVRAAGSWVDLH